MLPIESAHKGICEKINYLKRALELLDDNYIANAKTECIEIIEFNYVLSTASIIKLYYQSPQIEDTCTINYYRILASDNIVSKLDDHANEIITFIKNRKKKTHNCDNICSLARSAINNRVPIIIAKSNYDFCKCGATMQLFAESAEIRCTNMLCGRIKNVVGSVSKDDQYCPQESQRSKLGGYDITQRFNIHLLRLQGLDGTKFDDDVKQKIRYIMRRDGYDNNAITCKQVREILKDSYVNATRLNSFVPSLVKELGGAPPPMLSHNECERARQMFGSIIRFYEKANKGGRNKPFISYFAYQVLRQVLIGTEKLRILEYIHLQSRETIIKNNNIYREICRLSKEVDREEDCLIYIPVDPSGIY